MRNLLALIFVLIVGIGLLYYVVSERKKIEDGKNKELIESVAIASSSSASSSSAAPTDFHLRVLSVPNGANVMVDGEEVGVTPFEMPIPPETKKLQLSFDDYDPYTRQVPASRDAEGDLVWKIQLKKVKKQASLKSRFFIGTLEPFSVQLRSVSLHDFDDKIIKEFERVAKFCLVKINGADWVRVVVGPASSKLRATALLTKMKTDYPNAFVTSKQKCLRAKE